MLRWARRLREQGVVGLNERNLECINPHNPRALFPLVDDKLRTKLLARRHGVATPELLGVIRHQSEIRGLDGMIEGVTGFAIKPSRGSGGKGILVVSEYRDGSVRKSSGVWIPRYQVERYLSNLLSGLYTLGGAPDAAVVESLIIMDPRFADFSFDGVPDIRIIVYRGYPLMAMIRLSTAASDGKANLHQGAIGVGLDLASGSPVHAVQYDRPVTRHPDTGRPLTELPIENWTRLLTLAARCHEMTGLGFIGADMVVDHGRGPLLLELNARPGLSIQIANGCGLAPRIGMIDAWERERGRGESPLPSPDERVALAQQAFGSG